MTAFSTALEALRRARDALNALDLGAAQRHLGEHDGIVRDALAAEPPRLARSEGEALADAQRVLLDQLDAVQRGVATELQATRKGGAAARAYLGAAGA